MDERGSASRSGPRLGREALDARTLEPIRGRADIVVVPQQVLPRLRGAAALVTTPVFAAPVVA